MYRTALTYPQTMRYLELLVDRGLLSIRQDGKGRDVFEATEKGRQTLQHLKAIIETLAITDNGS
jgi:predicted transcriptional regulator